MDQIEPYPLKQRTFETTDIELRFICPDFLYGGAMTLDEKIRYGMAALSGASLVFASLGVHLGPLEIIGGNAVG